MVSVCPSPKACLWSWALWWVSAGFDSGQGVRKSFTSRNFCETTPASMRFVRVTQALHDRFGDQVRSHWGQLMRSPDTEQNALGIPGIIAAMASTTNSICYEVVALPQSQAPALPTGLG